MFHLPREIQTLIWSFDSTEKTNYNQVIHQLQYTPVMEEIRQMVALFPNNRSWVRLIFDFQDAFHHMDWIVVLSRDDFWKKFKSRSLKHPSF